MVFGAYAAPFLQHLKPANFLTSLKKFHTSDICSRIIDTIHNRWPHGEDVVRSFGRVVFQWCEASLLEWRLGSLPLEC